MNLYWHHVAKKGIADLYKTVFQQVGIDVLARADEEFVRVSYLPTVESLFGGGSFNCWGAPAGAKGILDKLSDGDVVLLHTTPGEPKNIPVLCSIKLFEPVLAPSLSWLLWGDERYPYIFFFETERIDYDWESFKEDLGYETNYRPDGRFHSVSNKALEKWGGANGFVTHLRMNHGVSDTTLHPVTPDEYRSDTATMTLTKSNMDEFVDAGIAMGGIDYQLTILDRRSDQEQTPVIRESSASYNRDVLYSSSAFSIGIKRLYQYRCAICSMGARGPDGETEVHAAHIFPVSKHGPDDLRNGICLCSKHHWALDVGWIVFTDSYYVLVHPNLPKGPDYDFIHSYGGVRLRLPLKQKFWPHIAFLKECRRIAGFGII